MAGARFRRALFSSDQRLWDAAELRPVHVAGARAASANPERGFGTESLRVSDASPQTSARCALHPALRWLAASSVFLRLMTRGSLVLSPRVP
eukprot:3980113-Pleurochrysis_carterae.AAC.2